MLRICRRDTLLYFGALGVCASLVSACTIIRLDQLVPSTAIDIVSSDGNLLEYVPNPCPQRHVDEIFKSHTIVVSNVSKLRVALPSELAQSQVINKLIYQSHYVSARAVQTASLVLTNPTDPPAAAKPPSDIALGEVFDFGRLIPSGARDTPRFVCTDFALRPQNRAQWLNILQDGCPGTGCLRRV
jgi:hypothetical protein